MFIVFNTPVSSNNKADRHDRAEILVKVALNTIHPHTFNLSIEKYTMFLFIHVAEQM
jgi:hypothetical protein